MTAELVAPDPVAPGNETPALRIRGLSVDHGQLRALTDVSIEVPRGKVFAIIGANGAGKSTLLRTIAGLHEPASGTIELDGMTLAGRSPADRLAAGVALVPEGRRLFSSLTVEENLLVGAHRGRPGPWTIDSIYALFGWMASRRRQRAGLLSGGEQQAVAIGRALVANPIVLLLDELSLGLSPLVVRQIYALMPRILEAGTTVMLVEQDVSQALRVADEIQCFLEGRATLSGPPASFTPAQIEAAYFGLAPDTSLVAARGDGGESPAPATGGRAP